MLTRKGKIAVGIVRRMHIVAGRILNVADFIEDRVVLKELE